MQSINSGKSVGISAKLTLWVGILVVLILAITSTVSYFDAKNHTYELLKENQLKTMDDVKVTFENYSKSKQKAIEVLAYESAKKLEDENISLLLDSFKKAFDFDIVFIAFDKNNKMLLSNGTILDKKSNFDITKQIWYQEAKNNKGITITQPYKSPIDQEIDITYVFPIYKNNQLIAFVGGDYNLDKFSKDVLSLGHSSTTYAAVYDSEGRIIFHEVLDRILTKNTLSVNIANAIKENPEYIDLNKRDILFPVFDDKGIKYEAMCDTSSNGLYRICAVTLDSNYTSAVNSILMKQVIVGIIAIIIALILIRFLISRSLSPLAAIQTGLTSFFDFINHKTKNVSTIEVKSNDEFGQISNAINENILATKRGLEQDNQAVKESVQTVSVVEGGNLTARITANPRNPQLIELKNVLNRLLDALQTRVGSDMNEIQRVFNSYKSLDFTTEVKDANGAVEVTTNALGQEIIKMLKQSSDFANALANESGKLQTAVQSLTTSSNSQAQSLEETAAALEEITSSMQNVSVKTSD
ncbi:methyl-accepting chemotaxis protein, partial [Campylobacter jejuni]|nr:methyl-accepting chemotaxis protein [Campylobacter jejuni]ELN9083283.1 methyl-accepting chemotaxis protein [Campylobacter jejuni]ELP0510934.1 methyl-accepting chemotaxis protein [Campylobacter jejuni]